MCKNFYCAKKCGDPNFSINEWNEAYKFCVDGGLSESETNFILHPETHKPCDIQCEACANIVLDTQNKNKKIRKSKSDKTNLK